MPSGITPPIAAAWLYMSDDQNYNTIPEYWSAINFKLVDILFVGPAGIQQDGTFGLYQSSKTGPLAHRFEWVVKTARTQNPNIKIIVSQWWGSSANIWGSDLSNLQDDQAIQKYTDSVRAFLETWLSVSGGVDGYDIDYEAGNVVSSTPTILSQIRDKLDAFSKTHGGRPFYVTVSPAELQHLGKAVTSLDFVNMQTYAGGSYLTPKMFTDLNFHSNQLLYGICPETGCGGKSLQDVEQEFKQGNLAGIHLWRLNSDNYEHELAVQKQVYEFLHPSSK